MMKFDDKLFIGEIIKKYRKNSNLTQAELAEMVNLSDQHMSRIEGGYYMPSLTTFFAIAQVLKMDLRELGFNVDTTNNPVKDKLINSIISANNAELILYENLIDTADKCLNKIKRELF